MFKSIRDAVMYAFTFWKSTATRKGIRLSLRGASLRVRYALLTNYECEDARLCQKLFTADDRVLELGSAIGFLSLYCTKILRVKAFAMVEANPNLADNIAENFALNATPQPPLILAAAGASDGQATFNISRDYYSSGLNQNIDNCTSVTVEQLTIPSLISRLDFVPNALIMDIEGSEVDIPIDHLALFDKIVMELHGRFVGNDKIERFIRNLEAAGFRKLGSDGYSCAFAKEGVALP